MKELAKWIFFEVITIPLCIVGAVACSFGARMVWLGMPKQEVILDIAFGAVAAFLAILAIGFALAFAFMIVAGLEIDSEIIKEIMAHRKD